MLPIPLLLLGLLVGVIFRHSTCTFSHLYTPSICASRAIYQIRGLLSPFSWTSKAGLTGLRRLTITPSLLRPTSTISPAPISSPRVRPSPVDTARPMWTKYHQAAPSWHEGLVYYQQQQDRVTMAMLLLGIAASFFVVFFFCMSSPLQQVSEAQAFRRCRRCTEDLPSAAEHDFCPNCTMITTPITPPCKTAGSVSSGSLVACASPTTKRDASCTTANDQGDSFYNHVPCLDSVDRSSRSEPGVSFSKYRSKSLDTLRSSDSPPRTIDMAAALYSTPTRSDVAHDGLYAVRERGGGLSFSLCDCSDGILSRSRFRSRSKTPGSDAPPSAGRMNDTTLVLRYYDVGVQAAAEGEAPPGDSGDAAADWDASQRSVNYLRIRETFDEMMAEQPYSIIGEDAAPGRGTSLSDSESGSQVDEESPPIEHGTVNRPSGLADARLSLR
ncbi:hypothetical protein AcV5_006718 [Taiwanofungus camphoratus]|nr:hypothetical protein AcV5_006718 [Antrodia cinnamomea]